MPDRKKRYYAVVKGRRPGIYTSWDGSSGARCQVQGFAGAVFKGFASQQEAEDFLKNTPAPKRRTRSVTPESAHVSDQPQGDEIHIYTDGGCIDNPGPGGWAAVIIEGDTRREISGGYRFTTNNRMELQACIQALRSINKGARAVLFTDSQYVANAMQKGWALRWRSQNWMRDRSHRAENADLWAELLGLVENLEISFHWVRGHAGNPENERCDELAGMAARGGELLVDGVFERLQRGKNPYQGLS